jgi:O-antigen ligase
MSEKLIYILPVLALALFFANIIRQGSSARGSLLFILYFLPVMNLKVTPESLGGFTVFDVIVIYSVVFLFKDFIYFDDQNSSPIFLWLFILLIIVVLLGGLNSEFSGNTFLRLFKILPIFIFGRFAILECRKDPEFHSEIIKSLKISYLISLSFVFIQLLVGIKFRFYPDLAPNTLDPVLNIIRYPGVFYDSQASGQFLAIGSFLFLYNFNQDLNSKVLNYAVFLAAIWGILLAGSRAAFGGFAVGLLVVLLMAGRAYRLYGGMLLILALFSYWVFAPQIGLFNRADNLSDDYLFRKNIWNKAIDIAVENPVLGIGLGNYQDYVTRHAQDQYLELEDGKFVYFDQPENGYLKVLVELGFLGFAVFLLFILLTLCKGFYSQIAGEVDSQIYFLIGALINWLVAFNTVYSLYDVRILIMITTLICLISVYPKKENATYEVVI